MIFSTTQNRVPKIIEKSWGIYWVYPNLKGSLGVKQLGNHPKGTRIFPMKKELFQNTVLEMIPHVAPSLMSVFLFRAPRMVLESLLIAIDNSRSSLVDNDPRKALRQGQWEFPAQPAILGPFGRDPWLFVVSWDTRILVSCGMGAVSTGEGYFFVKRGRCFSEPKKRIAARKKGKLLRKKRVVGRFFEQKPFELGWIGTLVFFVVYLFCRFLEDFLVRILPNKALVVICIQV